MPAGHVQDIQDRSRTSRSIFRTSRRSSRTSFKKVLVGLKMVLRTLLNWDNYKDFLMLELQSAQEGVKLQPIRTIFRPIKALILGNNLGTTYAKNIGV